MILLSEKEVKIVEKKLDETIEKNQDFNNIVKQLTHYYFIHQDFKKANNYLLFVKKQEDKPSWFYQYETVVFSKEDLQNLFYRFDIFERRFEKIENDLDRQIRKSILIDLLHDCAASINNKRFSLYMIREIAHSIRMLGEKHESDIVETYLNVVDQINQADKDTTKEKLVKTEDQSELVKSLQKDNIRLETENASLTKQVQNLVEQIRSSQMGETNQDCMRYDYSEHELLIFGESHIKKHILLGVCKDEGIPKNNIELKIEYDDIKNYDIKQLQYNSKYSCILLGEMPHSVKGKGVYSSAIEALKNESGYPKCIEVLNETGKLRITKTSLRSSLRKFKDYIVSVS